MDALKSNDNHADNDNNKNDDDDVDDIAFAAEAAAEAVEAADAASQQQQLEDALLTCRICGRGNEEGRPILRFLPVDHNVNAARAAPGVRSFMEDIGLHIFCGKTASILPSVNQPELEILTKAGLKNKHGIGAEVNAALARTRCAVLQTPEAKEKQYYLVREFEAHLAAIRHTHIQFLSAPAAEGGGNGTGSSQAPQPLAHPTQAHPQPPQQDIGTILHTIMDQQEQHPHHQQPYNPYQHMQPPLQPTPDYSIDPPPPSNSNSNTLKPTAYKASAGMIHKPGSRGVRNNNNRNNNQEELLIPHPSSSSSSPPLTTLTTNNHNHNHTATNTSMLTDEGKIQCDCGGTHWPTGTPRGAASFRSHISTKRHQKWAQDNDVSGLAVDV